MSVCIQHYAVRSNAKIETGDVCFSVSHMGVCVCKEESPCVHVFAWPMVISKLLRRHMA